MIKHSVLFNTPLLPWVLLKVFGKQARLWARVGDGVVKCLVCNHECLLKPGSRGICGNYVNDNSVLVHLGYGRISAVESRPIEVKPLFHYWPNSTALTFSGWGCNFYCPWCQNHHLSFKHPDPSMPVVPPESLVEQALRAGDEGLCASFNEPATLFDYLLEVFELASRRGLYSCVVTNGYFTTSAVDLLVEAGCDGWSIDIKGWPGMKKPLSHVKHERVFETARRVLDNGGHVEMVYLVVTGVNDSMECAEWIIKTHLDKLGSDVPLHVNRYYPSHAWTKPPTPASKLIRIASMARSEGVKFVYIGNLGDPELESTRCPRCGKILVYRTGYRVIKHSLAQDNRCPRCGEKIPVRGRIIQK